MVTKTLDFWQIVYRKEQERECYPFAKIFFNTTLTDAFENDVISKIVPLSTADYISVCSWRLRQKRGESSTPSVLKNDLELSENKILSKEFDVAILTPRRPTHPALLMASEWHGKAWNDAFEVFNEGFLKKKGTMLPRWRNGQDLKRAIYENHFIARREIYQDYVRQILTPAIEFCETYSGNVEYEYKSNDGQTIKTKNVFKVDSGYITKKRNTEEIKEYQQKSGRMDWPIEPFVLERLFSIWINDQCLKVINL